MLGAGNQALDGMGRKRPSSAFWQSLGPEKLGGSSCSGERVALSWGQGRLCVGKRNLVITAQCLRGPGKDIGPCPQEASITTGEENLLYGWSKKGGTESVLSISKLCGSQSPGRERGRVDCFEVRDARLANKMLTRGK